MDLWKQLNDFSGYDKTIPCVLCKEKALINCSLTAFKCETCDHIFKEDGSKVEYGCFCKTCNPEKEKVENKDVVSEVVKTLSNKKPKSKKRGKK